MGRSSQHIVPDDPGFELQFNLPEFDLGLAESTFIARISQYTGNSSSQLSPLNRLSSQGGPPSIIGGIEVSGSSEHDSLYLQLPFGRDSMDPRKPGNGEFRFGGEEEVVPAFDDWGIDIDADGNVVPSFEEPELPPLPRTPTKFHPNIDQAQAPQPVLDADGDLAMDHGGSQQPEAVSQPTAPQALSKLPGAKGPVMEAAGVPTQRRKVRRPVFLGLDAGTKISKQEFRSWDTDYLARQEAMRDRSKPSTAPAQARNNAWNFLFGRGLMDVGSSSGITGCPQPLASQFAGENLAKSLGVSIACDSESSANKRSSSEAFGTEEDEERRTRLRADDGEQMGRGIRDQGDVPPVLDQEVEVGREPGSALSDMPSLVPWNRPPSVPPGSSVHGSAKAASLQGGRHISASPLHGRGNIPQEIERFSDHPELDLDLDRHSPTSPRCDPQDSQLA